MRLTYAMRVPDKLLAQELRLLRTILLLARLGGRLRLQAHPRALPLRQPLRPRKRRLRCRGGQPIRGDACGDEGLGEEELLARGGAGAQAVDGRATDQPQPWPQGGSSNRSQFKYCRFT